MLVLPAICCWLVFGLVPSGQDFEAFCLVDIVICCCCFMQSCLLCSLKLDAGFGALFALLWQLFSMAASLQCCLRCLWELLSLAAAHCSVGCSCYMELGLQCVILLEDGWMPSLAALVLCQCILECTNDSQFSCRVFCWFAPVVLLYLQ